LRIELKRASRGFSVIAELLVMLYRTAPNNRDEQVRINVKTTCNGDLHKQSEELIVASTDVVSPQMLK